MDSFEWNKIAGAVLFALLLSVGLSIVSEVIFETEAPETPGYVIALATEEGTGEATGGEAPAVQSIAALLASADPTAGAAAAKKCGACHNFAEGGPNGVGPNLWNVVNRPIASHEGYAYDEAMHAFAETAGTWTFEHLNAFLADPKGAVPGTKMAFPGLKKDAERANVIAYLRTLSASPAPLPEVTATDTEAQTQVAAVEPAATATDAGQAAPAAEAPAPEAVAAEAPAEPAPATQEPAVAEAPAEPAPAPAAEVAEAPATAAPTVATPAAPAAAAPEQQVAQAEAPAADAAAAGDPAKGATFAKRCGACHNLEKGGRNGVGPHLFGVVGRPIASVADFSYSAAMKTFSEGGAKTWDEASLDTYLADPKGVVPGTKMAFPGIKKDTDRANLIAYLKTLTE